MRIGARIGKAKRFRAARDERLKGGGNEIRKDSDPISGGSRQLVERLDDVLQNGLVSDQKEDGEFIMGLAVKSPVVFDLRLHARFDLRSALVLQIIK